MHDDSLDSVDRAVLSGWWVYVAAVEVYAVGIDSKMSSCNTIGIKNGEDKEYEIFPQNSAYFTIFC